MRSLGTASSGITDQYADGKAAKLWQLYIGKQLVAFIDMLMARQLSQMR